MRTNRQIILIGCALLLAMTGCGSLGPHGLARNVAPGKTLWSSAITLIGTPAGRSDVPTNTTQMELGMTHGITRGFELGVRAFGVPAPGAWSWGFDTQFKLRLHRATKRSKGVDVALAPRLSFEQLGRSGATWETTSAHLALMVGFNVPGGNQIILSPQVGGLFIFDQSSEGAQALQAGGSVGFAWKVADAITLVPNMTFLYSTLQVAEEKNVWFYRLALLFLIGDPGT